jgi:hypothetical protein
MTTMSSAEQSRAVAPDSGSKTSRGLRFVERMAAGDEAIRLQRV